ncbi:UPF0061-domain-containing protein [Vararia minispora EC-137]|uniref:UPF0061-domain-containing protein n=1 Tax=Vararia minispora EC-137 TaxID=1314806 RepID=A0ACB8QUH7_9AGAM|nr:UPF0061-domain-containing protein [Vararia minispora EC-137]
MTIVRAMATTAPLIKKLPIACLPLPPPSQLPIHNLTADPIAPTVPAFRHVVATKPSLQRRARLLQPPAHFSHVAPLPLSFPFEIEPPDDPELKKMEREEYIEWWLSQREALHPREAEAREEGKEDRTYEVLYSHNEERDKQPTVLLALSESGLRDCLPHLDAGNAFSLLGSPSLSASGPDQQVEEAPDPTAQTLIDVLGARAMLLTPEDADVSLAPWSLRYSGHQFGQWAGQLGDGRAISILATPHPANPDTLTEVQLKGAGRTPFSRSADGLAVVRSSVREYLCAEAMHALGISTTRSLALVALPSLPVQRERLESACITARLAPSFIRIGSFEALNPPERLFFFGGGQQEADLTALTQLARFVAEQVLKVKKLGEEGEWAREIVLEATRRNAEMVAGWQAYGFMHGVINTDNVSIMGLTIDYGPYAFMDVYDPMHICNHTDEMGRYAYKHQPAMILFALRQLLRALAPLIGAQSSPPSSSSALPETWAKDATQEQIDAWAKAGTEATEVDMNALFHATYAVKYAEHMRARLGLLQAQDTDSALFESLLGILSAQYLDFHLSFRTLASFRPSLLSPSLSPELETFIKRLFDTTSRPEWLPGDATQQWLDWLDKFAARIKEERGDSEEGEAQRCADAHAKNPRFVLRQWVLEEIIARVEKDGAGGRRALGKIMQMACSPFESWGAEDDARSDEELEPEIREERRVCAVGAKEMLGFQCSCSS